MKGKGIMSYRLITDATADLTRDMLNGLPEISIIPMEIFMDGTLYTYGADGTITTEQFYNELRKGKFSSTSQVNPTQYEELFIPILESGEDILYLCFTSGLSGMYQCAKQCAERLMKKYPQRKIVCIDTLCASLGEGFLVCEALSRQAEGYSLEKLAEWVISEREYVCQWFTVDTFEHLKHGGRVSGTAAIVGNILQIKPLLHVSAEGRLEVMDKTIRGRKRAITALCKKMQEGWTPDMGHRVWVGHGGCRETAEVLAKEIKKQLPDAEIHIAEVGSVIGSHTGPGILGLIFWGVSR